MVFSSAIFLFLFLPVTYLVYRLLPVQLLRNGWLALASLVFYGFGQPGYVLLLLVSVLANFLFGLWLQNTAKYRKWIAGFAVIINLLALGAFKYLDFLTSIWNSLSGMNLPSVGLVLPIGRITLQNYCCIFHFFHSLLLGLLSNIMMCHNRLTAVL